MIPVILIVAWIVCGVVLVVLVSALEKETLDPFVCTAVVFFWPVIVFGFALSKLSEALAKDDN